MSESLHNVRSEGRLRRGSTLLAASLRIGTVVILAVWLCSVFVTIAYIGERSALWLGRGTLGFGSVDDAQNRRARVTLEGLCIHRPDIADRVRNWGLASALQYQLGLVLPRVHQRGVMMLDQYVFVMQGVNVPIWPLALILVLTWLRLRPRRRRPGLCTTCGYDLTGNTSGVCPECGLHAT